MQAHTSIDCVSCQMLLDATDHSPLFCVAPVAGCASLLTFFPAVSTSALNSHNEPNSKVVSVRKESVESIGRGRKFKSIECGQKHKKVVMFFRRMWCGFFQLYSKHLFHNVLFCR